MTAYLDSSAVVKLVLADEGAREELLSIVHAEGSLVTSRLTYVETRAAIASARRSGRLSRVGHATAIAEFDTIWPTLVVVDLTEAVASDAASVAEAYGLRAGDAIQLASLRDLDEKAVPMIVWDVRLRAAARAEGYRLYPFEV